MCGISGFVGRGTKEDLKRMNDVIQHRGPDAEGFYMDEEKAVFLGHRRLSIVDIAGGQQPMQSADGNIIIIFNGEIYNHQDIRQELVKKGYHFQTDHSDTETLIYAYAEWGKAMVKKLNGMWSLAIYDRNANKIFLSRDRFGKKPLFYTLQEQTFVFGSELNAIKKHQYVQTRVSKKSLKKYFAYGYIPAPNSVFEKCFKLPGGHNLEFDIASFTFKIEKYWEYKIEPFDTIPHNAEKIWGDQLLDLLEKSVKRRLMSDVPLGFFLSGGIDSSALVALASRYLSGDRLKTFSIGFDQESFDETSYSEQIAGLFHTDHHKEILSIEKSRELLQGIVARLDEPMGDSSLLPTYLLCRETRKHVTVALGGDGADELFCGYDPFRAINKAKWYNTIVPKPLHNAILYLAARMPVSHSNMSLDFKIKRTLRGLSYPAELWNPVWLGPLAPDELNDLFSEKTDVEEVYEEAIETWDNCHSHSLIEKTMEFYAKLYLQDDILVKVDRASMMNSLEVRAPFLDIEFVDFVRKIPYQYKYRNGETKFIMKKAFEKLLPHEILYRPKKGFGVPIGEWFLNGELKPVENQIEKMLDCQFIQKKLTEHKSLHADNRLFLWNLWLFQQWEMTHKVN